MATDAASPSPVPVRQIESWIDIVFKHYGPYAFGIATVWFLWSFIAQPQIENQKVDFDKQMEVLQIMREQNRALEKVADSMTETADTLSVTAAILERTSKRLEDWEHGVDR